eukprot:TRINITY_DN3623_c0_g1_i1.p1 TRINITY_DN3623_c0_g1~~TRINITY_DN3623_c0_g1_i1.p1  ORF type:complete len:243 (+),score=71.28 TRINITY_DN3623_c0_g1_i1:80-808(+)
MLGKELCRFALQKDGKALNYVPNKFKTREFFEIAVRNNPMALEYVPYDLRDKNLCKLAVSNCGEALRYCSLHKKNNEICIELCMIAVRQDGNVLKEVVSVSEDSYPEGISKILTKDICRAAIVQNMAAWKYVPDRMKDEDLYEIMVRRRGEIINEVPEEKKSLQLKGLAVMENVENIVHVKEEERDEVIRIAVGSVGEKKDEGRGKKEMGEKKEGSNRFKVSTRQGGSFLEGVDGLTFDNEV